MSEFLARPHIGVSATLRRDGRPDTVPVWFLHVDDAFWITGTCERGWCKQLLADPRASLCVEATTPVAGHVGVDGSVIARELPDFDIWPISRQLVDKYVTPERRDACFTNMQTDHRLPLELIAEVVRAIDMRIHRGQPANREFQQRHASA